MTKIKDMPKVDRPREKFLEGGADSLTKGELLSILLGSGIKGVNVKKLSEQILKKFGNELFNATVDELCQIKGIGQAKALQIVSAFSLIKRINDEQKPQENLILSTNDALSFVSDLKNKKQEHLVCLYLNARNILLQKETVSIGTLDRSIIHPREIFAPGLKMHASGVILVHNHPSGDPTPSKQDKEVAWRIVEAGKLMGINVVDFIIIAEDGVSSILGEVKKIDDISSIEYVADGEQTSLFDMLVDERSFMGYKASLPVKQIKKDSGAVKIIDLFAGIGGFHLAFHNSGAECVFASEWNEPARKTYRHNLSNISPELFETGNFVGDITKIKPKDIPDFNILCAGFPCQPFSQAGFKKGFNETRGTLFFDIVNIISEKKPEAFFLENVRHLFKHDNGRTFETIKKVIEQDLGYSFFYKIVKASDYGMPQHRPRLFMVGFKDKNIDFKFPNSVPLRYTMSEVFGGKCKKDVGFTLRVGGRGSKITDRRNWDSYFVDGKVRRLSSKEGKKMQGFPDDFEFPVTESQAMKQLGNSVAVPAIQMVAQEIVKKLKEHDKYKK